MNGDDELGADVVEHLREVEIGVLVLDLGQRVSEHLVGLAQVHVRVAVEHAATVHTVKVVLSYLATAPPTGPYSYFE